VFFLLSADHPAALPIESEPAMPDYDVHYNLALYNKVPLLLLSLYGRCPVWLLLYKGWHHRVLLQSVQLTFI